MSRHLDEIGKAKTDDIRGSRRLACLSEFGLNLLQQRLVWHMTRFAVPTYQLYEVSAHTIEEADILEDWNDIVCGPGGMAEKDAAALLEEFLRADRGDGRTLQHDLRDPQRRAAVRSACRARRDV